ncbi:MAG: hypothetical protein LBI18_09085, partial [Planctomycetaceae bacterium]|nr:hypothetical protein [Planctomycetaceae bacterium]
MVELLVVIAIIG